jgi:hypothetical protein
MNNFFLIHDEFGAGLEPSNGGSAIFADISAPRSVDDLRTGFPQLLPNANPVTTIFDATGSARTGEAPAKNGRLSLA